jgi:hypothetical protein
MEKEVLPRVRLNFSFPTLLVLLLLPKAGRGERGKKKLRTHASDENINPEKKILHAS